LFLAKNPKKRLNQLFSAGFIAWSLSMVLNGILFAVAYRSLTAANILRDFAVVFGVLSAFILFAAAYGIYFGAESLNWILYISSIIIAGVLSGFGAVNDWVTLDGLGGFKTTDNLIGKICTQIITAVFVVAANVLLILTYRSSKNPQAKKRVGFFVIGYSTIIIGLLMFVIDSFIQISPYVFPTFALIAWVMGPILMLIGFYVKAESDSPTLAKEAAMSESQLLKTKQEQKIERPS
jgi:glucan phosphoethanolaminetransferase (alkaline phosphatase superfamily)